MDLSNTNHQNGSSSRGPEVPWWLRRVRTWGPDGGRCVWGLLKGQKSDFWYQEKQPFHLFCCEAHVHIIWPFFFLIDLSGFFFQISRRFYILRKLLLAWYKLQIFFHIWIVSLGLFTMFFALQKCLIFLQLMHHSSLLCPFHLFHGSWIMVRNTLHTPRL